MKILSVLNKCTLLAFFMSLANLALACTCSSQGIFQDFVQLHPIVVRGIVAEHGETIPNSQEIFATMKVNVTDVVKGSYPYDSFDFYGDTGMSCLHYITLNEFPIGSEHLFILESEEAVQPLMVCGESFVSILGDTIKGHVLTANGYETYELDLDYMLRLLR